jgi:type VI protein secretion system component VasF
MSQPAPTLEDLEAARAELTREIERRDNYNGNNPNKYATDVRMARERVALLERALKALGQLARTPHEELEAKLNAAFPRARHKDIVTFENEQYQRGVTPATRTLSGNVASWDKGWRKHSSPPVVNKN